MTGMQGWSALGEALAGRIGQPGAYEEGQMTGHKLELAMQQARRERANALIDTVRADSFQQLPTMGGELGVSDAQARLMAAGGGNASQLMAALGDARGMGYQEQAAEAATRRYGPDNPNAPLFGLANGPVALGDIKDGMAIGDRFADGGGGLTVTPMGEATIAQRRASAASSYATARNADARTQIAQGQYALSVDGRWNPGGRAAGGAAGGGAAAPKLTEGQSKDLVYLKRGDEANNLLASMGNNLTMTGGQQGVRGIADNLVRGLPWGLGEGAAGNSIVSGERQQAEQAGREFLSAVLRKDTGAAITAQEFDIYGATYLPRPGDSEGTLQQKARARQIALDAIATGLGPDRAVLARPVGSALGDNPSPRQAATTAPARISSAQQFNALPSGTVFIAPDGSQRRKP